MSTGDECTPMDDTELLLRDILKVLMRIEEKINAQPVASPDTAVTSTQRDERSMLVAIKRLSATPGVDVLSREQVARAAQGMCRRLRHRTVYAVEDLVIRALYDHDVHARFARPAHGGKYVVFSSSAITLEMIGRLKLGEVAQLADSSANKFNKANIGEIEE